MSRFFTSSSVHKVLYNEWDFFIVTLEYYDRKLKKERMVMPFHQSTTFLDAFRLLARITSYTSILGIQVFEPLFLPKYLSLQTYDNLQKDRTHIKIVVESSLGQSLEFQFFNVVDSQLILEYYNRLDGFSAHIFSTSSPR